MRPAFRRNSRKDRVSGSVRYEAIISKEGIVEKVTAVEETQPEYGFTEEGEKALLQWRFEPSTYEGKPVRVKILFSVEWQLI